jgi:hypothetical protein
MKDIDLLVLKKARKVLLESTSKRMLFANLQFLMDYFIYHPSKELPDKFK